MGKTAAERRALAGALMGAYSSMAIIHVAERTTATSKSEDSGGQQPDKLQANK